MISAINLRKRYGDFVAVDDISFELQKGEIVGLLGPNGAGKTTTMRMLTGFLSPSSGEISVNQFDLASDPLKAKASMGYLPENTPLYEDMKVEEFLLFIAELRGIGTRHRRKAVRDIAEKVGLKDRLRQDIGHLSKGYRQRVGLAQALLHDPEVLILDEPTSGLDPNQIIEIRSLIKHLGKHKTILFSTHILSEAEATCDRILIINKGRIVASGTSEQLRAETHGKVLIRVKIEGDGSGLRKILEEISGVERIMKLDETEKGFSIFEVETPAGIDLRREVTQKIVSSGFALVEVQREGKSLEDVFATLTQPS